MKAQSGGWRGLTVGVLIGAVAVALLQEFLLRPQARAAAAQECQALIAAQKEAWNRGDLPGFLQDYLMSDELTFFSDDTVTLGWVKVNERYTARYGGGNMGRLEFSDLRIDALATDVAMIRGRWSVSGIAQPNSGLFTIILRKTAQGWKIVHDHTSARQKN